MRRNSKEPYEPDATGRLNRKTQSGSAETAHEQELGRRELDSKAVVKAARDFARNVAGENKVRFLHAFQIALNVAVSAMRAEPDDSNLFDKVTEHHTGLLSERFFSDPTFVENTVNLIENDLLILGGTPADEFPDCVAVGPFLAGPHSNPWPCSGTLIAPNAVLTARHCVSSVNYVYVGPNVKVYKKPFKVIDPVIYTPYNGDHHNDLAILFLEENVEKVEGVKPRPLASTEMIDAATYVVAAGYGSTNPSGVGGAGRRLQAMLTIISRLCTAAEHYEYQCHKGLEMLAQGSDKNSCTGDSGGPAYIKATDNNWYLAGVTSRPMTEEPCGGHIYVRVDKYKSWIDEQLKKHPV